MEDFNFERAIKAGFFGMAFSIAGILLGIVVSVIGSILNDLILSIGLSLSVFFSVLFIVSTFVLLFSLADDIYKIYKLGQKEFKRIKSATQEMKIKIKK